jgi:hypothetical protein
MADPGYLEKLSKRLTDEGKLIEAGWVGLRAAVIPPEASAEQLDDMRNAFFAGAQHLFASIMTILDEDKEPTEDDLHRLSMINQELQKFVEELMASEGIERKLDG